MNKSLTKYEHRLNYEITSIVGGVVQRFNGLVSTSVVFFPTSYS